MAIQEGKKIWGESLLTPLEWNAQTKVYPNVYNMSYPPEQFPCEFKWRQGMGAGLSEAEIKVIGERLDKFREMVKETLKT